MMVSLKRCVALFSLLCCVIKHIILAVPHPDVLWAYCFLEVKDWIV